MLLSSRTRLLTPGHTNPKRSEPKRNEPKPRREAKKLVQRFSSCAALYPLSYREVVAIEHKTALKNPLRHLRQNRSKSYFAVNGKIDTTIKLFFISNPDDVAVAPD